MQVSKPCKTRGKIVQSPNYWNTGLIYIIYKDPVCTSQKTQCAWITKTNLLLLYHMGDIRKLFLQLNLGLYIPLLISTNRQLNLAVRTVTTKLDSGICQCGSLLQLTCHVCQLCPQFCRTSLPKKWYEILLKKRRRARSCPTSSTRYTFTATKTSAFCSQTSRDSQVRRLRLKCDGTRAETRFRPSAKRTSPFK